MFGPHISFVIDNRTDHVYGLINLINYICLGDSFRGDFALFDFSKWKDVLDLAQVGI